MNNLGLYQWFTTTAKKVGGPGKLIGMFIGSGMLAGSAIGSVITNKWCNFKANRQLKALATYSVTKEAEIVKVKLTLKLGDKITILASDGDSILIIKNDDSNNPYFVSSEFLKECSNYTGQ